MGFLGVFVTVDTPILGTRERDERCKLASRNAVQHEVEEDLSPDSAPPMSNKDPSLCWEDIAWIRSILGGGIKLGIKGVLCAEDALLAVRYGCDAIVVSNHGGRQLDHTLSAVEALEDVMRVVSRGGIEVLVDGGITRGSDVFKCLALGARAVGIGRPVLWGLAAYGERGVDKVIHMLRKELRQCMALMGVSRIEDISRGALLCRL